MSTSLSPLLLSLKISFIASIIVFISGVFFARIFARREFFGKSAVEAFFLLPLVLPPTVVGFGLLLLFSRDGFFGRWLYDVFHIQVLFSVTGAVIASTVVAFPLMYKSATAAFESVEKNYENAARIMGASEWRVFFTITFPLAWPGLLAGLILSFARALGEFGATLMVAGYIPGKTDTIPLVIYFSAEAGNTDIATLWVIVIVAIGFSTMVWLNWWSKRKMERYRLG